MARMKLTATLLLVLCSHVEHLEGLSDHNAAPARPSCSQLIKSRHYTGAPLPKTPESVTQFREGRWNPPVQSRKQRRQAKLYGKSIHFIHIPKTGRILRRCTVTVLHMSYADEHNATVDVAARRPGMRLIKLYKSRALAYYTAFCYGSRCRWRGSSAPNLPTSMFI